MSISKGATPASSNRKSSQSALLETSRVMGRDNGKIKVQNGYELAQPFDDRLKTFKVQLKSTGFFKYL